MVQSGEPEDADELQRMPIADARRSDISPVGDPGHGAAHQIVAESEAPHFLPDARGRFAAQRLFAFQHVRLHLVEAEFELPALVVESDQLGRGVGDGVEQRGEQRLGAEAAVVVADGAHPQCGRKVAVHEAGLMARAQFDEGIAGPKRSTTRRRRAVRPVLTRLSQWRWRVGSAS